MKTIFTSLLAFLWGVYMKNIDIFNNSDKYRYEKIFDIPITSDHRGMARLCSVWTSGVIFVKNSILIFLKAYIDIIDKISLFSK